MVPQSSSILHCDCCIFPMRVTIKSFCPPVQGGMAAVVAVSQLVEGGMSAVFFAMSGNRSTSRGQYGCCLFPNE